MSSYFFVKSAIKNWLPRLQSHRGYRVSQSSQVIQENSLVAIQNAFSVGYKMVEFDVHLTSDQILILHHDSNVNQLVIRLSPFADLKVIKTIDTLEDVLLWLASKNDRSLKLNIELKSRSIFSAPLEQRTSQLVQKLGLTEQVMISSFNPLSLMWVRIYGPKIYRALLVTFEKEPGNYWYIKKMLLNILAAPHVLNLRYLDWEKEKYDAIARAVPVVLWTCNDFEFFKKNSQHIHGVISDTITPAMAAELT